MPHSSRFHAALTGGIATLALFQLAPTSHAATLAFYDFEAGQASVDTDAFSTASQINSEADDVLVGISPDLGNPGSAARAVTRFRTLNDAKLFEEPIKLTLTPLPGYAMNLYYFDTDLAALSTTVPNHTAQLFVFSSLDNYASPIHFNLATDTTISAPPQPGPYSSVSSEGMLLNQPVYSNVTTPVEFRLYVLADSVQFALLDNIRISGTMAVTPEPLGLTSAAAVLLLTAGRHRRQG